MEGLGINLPSLLAQVVNFLLLFGILYLVAYKPVMKMLDQRSQKVKESMEQTERIKDQAEQADIEFKKNIQQASRKSQEIIDRASKIGEEIRQKAQEEAKLEAEALLKRAKAEIQRERDDIVEELRRAYAELTIMAAEKIIEKTLDKKTHQQLIDEVLKDSAGLKGG